MYCVAARVADHSIYARATQHLNLLAGCQAMCLCMRPLRIQRFLGMEEFLHPKSKPAERVSA